MTQQLIIFVSLIKYKKYLLFINQNIVIFIFSDRSNIALTMNNKYSFVKKRTAHSKPKKGKRKKPEALNGN